MYEVKECIGGVDKTEARDRRAGVVARNARGGSVFRRVFSQAGRRHVVGADEEAPVTDIPTAERW